MRISIFRPVLCCLTLALSRAVLSAEPGPDHPLKADACSVPAVCVSSPTAQAEALPETVKKLSQQSIEAVAEVRKMRNEALRLLSAKQASVADIQKAVAILSAAQGIAASGAASEARVQTKRLVDEQANVAWNLALAYAKLGERKLAMDTLESLSQQVLLPHLIPMLEQEAAFKVFHDDERFKKIIAAWRIPASIGSQSALNSKYAEQLPVAERIAGLSLFWSNVRNNFVYVDRLNEVNWDQIYLDYLPKVIAAADTKEYYRILMQLPPLLNDAHTNVNPPDELDAEFYSRPPLRTARIAGHVLVTEVRSLSLRGEIKVGDEIVKIDNEAVDVYVRRHVSPYVSSSTPQDRELREYGYELLRGSAQTPVQLTLRRENAGEYTTTLNRQGYTDIEDKKLFEFKLLPNNIAYLSIDEFGDDAGAKAMEQAMPDIMKSNGLILDVRKNGGGSTDYGSDVLSYLTSQPIPNAKSFERSDTGLSHAHGDVVSWAVLDTGGGRSRPRAQVYTGPVVVLAGPQTFSAAEDFLLSFQLIKRGKIVGQASGGSTGQPYTFSLPGGGKARICVKRDTYPDGRQFVGFGIMPDVEVTPSVEDIRSGRDRTLEAASHEIDRMRTAGLGSAVLR